MNIRSVIKILFPECALAIMSNEERLMRFLFKSYNPSARPVFNSSKTVNVDIIFSLLNVKELVRSLTLKSYYFCSDFSKCNLNVHNHNAGIKFNNFPQMLSTHSSNAVNCSRLLFFFQNVRKQVLTTTGLLIMVSENISIYANQIFHVVHGQVIVELAIDC